MNISEVVTRLMYLQMQIRVFHWQTESYAQHQAFGGFYDSLNDTLDEFVEAIQGKYGRIKFNDTLVLKNIDEVDMDVTLNRAEQILVNDFELQDSEILNIRDEIVAAIDKLKYLLTLK